MQLILSPSEGSAARSDSGIRDATNGSVHPNPTFNSDRDSIPTFFSDLRQPQTQTQTETETVHIILDHRDDELHGSFSQLNINENGNGNGDMQSSQNTYQTPVDTQTQSNTQSSSNTQAPPVDPPPYASDLYRVSDNSGFTPIMPDIVPMPSWIPAPSLPGPNARPLPPHPNPEEANPAYHEQFFNSDPNFGPVLSPTSSSSCPTYISELSAQLPSAHMAVALSLPPDTSDFLIFWKTVLEHLFPKDEGYTVSTGWRRHSSHADHSLAEHDYGPGYVASGYVPEDWELEKNDLDAQATLVVSHTSRKGTYGHAMGAEKKLSLVILRLSPPEDFPISLLRDEAMHVMETIFKVESNDYLARDGGVGVLCIAAMGKAFKTVFKPDAYKSRSIFNDSPLNAISNPNRTPRTPNRNPTYPVWGVSAREWEEQREQRGAVRVWREALTQGERERERREEEQSYNYDYDEFMRSGRGWGQGPSTLGSGSGSRAPRGQRGRGGGEAEGERVGGPLKREEVQGEEQCEWMEDVASEVGWEVLERFAEIVRAGVGHGFGPATTNIYSGLANNTRAGTRAAPWGMALAHDAAAPTCTSLPPLPPPPSAPVPSSAAPSTSAPISVRHALGSALTDALMRFNPPMHSPEDHATSERDDGRWLPFVRDDRRVQVYPAATTMTAASLMQAAPPWPALPAPTSEPLVRKPRVRKHSRAEEDRCISRSDTYERDTEKDYGDEDHTTFERDDGRWLPFVRDDRLSHVQGYPAATAMTAASFMQAAPPLPALTSSPPSPPSAAHPTSADGSTVSDFIARSFIVSDAQAGLQDTHRDRSHRQSDGLSRLIDAHDEGPDLSRHWEHRDSSHDDFDAHSLSRLLNSHLESPSGESDSLSRYMDSERSEIDFERDLGGWFTPDDHDIRMDVDRY